VIAQLLALVMLASPPDSMLVTAAQLKARIADPRLVLIQIGPKAAYDTAHIAGARFVLFHELAARGPLALELPDPAALDSALETLGISDSSRVVLYWTDEWVSPTTRTFLTLTWFGLGGRVSILDGGLPAWRAVGGAVTKDPPVIVRGSLTPRPRSDVVVDAAFVRAQVDAHQWNIVDARNTEFYTGAKPGTSRELPPRSGHIPGAHSVPFDQMADSAGFFLKPEQVKVLLRTAGVDLAKPIVAYCHIGQQATAVWFAARLAGLDVRLYDGSFQDWAAHADFPLQSP